MKLLTVIFLLLASSFSSQPAHADESDVFIHSKDTTVFGQKFGSGKADFTFGDRPHVDGFFYDVERAKTKARKSVLVKCENISDRIERISPWTIHKVITCHSSLCYGREYGKVIASAIFKCAFNNK